MNVPSNQVHEAALALPVAERAALAYELLQSLKPPTGSSEDSPDFEDELERRAQAYDAGESAAAAWEAVSARLRQALADRKST